MKQIYIVTAYRWNQRDNHSYLIGCSKNLTRAKNMADSHLEYRGGKYSCHVEKMELNKFDNDVDEYSESIYIALGHDMS